MARRSVDTAQDPGRVRMTAGERKRQLAETAAKQFHRLGFHQVSIADVASAVGLTAPAIYRHFTNKQDLLAAAIGCGLDVVDAAATTSTDATLDEELDSLAAAAANRRDLWILLQREMRHLDAAHRAPLEARFADFAARFRAHIRQARPDLAHGDVALIATAVLAVLSSPSVYSTRQPAEDRRRILAAAARAAAHAALPEPAPAGSAAPATLDDRPTSGDANAARSEELLETSIRLFDERGYASVSLDDIGAAVGMAGPSIYHHYATKADLLVAAFTRATAWLAARRGRGATTLDHLVATYIDLGVQERHLFGVYVLEALNLPTEAGRRIRAGLDADIEAWSAALHRQRPELSEATRLVLVQAARAVVHDVVRIGRLHTRPGITQELQALLHAVLVTEIPGEPA